MHLSSVTQCLKNLRKIPFFTRVITSTVELVNKLRKFIFSGNFSKFEFCLVKNSHVTPKQMLIFQLTKNETVFIFIGSGPGPIQNQVWDFWNPQRLGH